MDGGNGSLGIALSISGPLCNPPLLTPAPTLGNRRLHSIPFHPFSTAENHPRNSPFLPPSPSPLRGARRAGWEGGGSAGAQALSPLPPSSRATVSLSRSLAARRSLSLSLSLRARRICMTPMYICIYVCMHERVYRFGSYVFLALGISLCLFSRFPPPPFFYRYVLYNAIA